MVAYIPGVGRYCKCGCERLIVGRKDKIFFRPACRRRLYDITKGRPIPKKYIDSTINLQILNEPFIHRKINLYLNKGNKIEIKIIPEYKELWDILDKIAVYRQLPYNERIVPMNLLSQVNVGK